jgi:hypothetical protein
VNGIAGAVLAPALHGRLVERDRVDARTQDAMHALLSRHFAGVDRATFDADLAAKTAVILLEDDDGLLHGFSTLLVSPFAAGDRRLTIVYSGDTIVERPWWGSPALARSWIAGVRRLTAGAAPADVFWLLLTSGFRTYRFLPVFYRAFYPNVDAPTPPGTQQLIDGVARDRFGAGYDATAGVVRLPRPQVLAGALLDVPPGRALDPHVRFFLARNPGYVRGDELVCWTSIADDNLTPAGRRMTRAGGRAACR